MNALERVLCTPELIDNILNTLEPRDLCKILTLDRAFFQRAMPILWYSVPYRATEYPDEKNSRGVAYMNAIKHLDIDDMPGDPNNLKDQKEILDAILQYFPNIVTARNYCSARPWSYNWKLRVERSFVQTTDKGEERGKEVKMAEQRKLLLDFNVNWKAQGILDTQSLDKSFSRWKDFTINLSITMRVPIPEAQRPPFFLESLSTTQADGHNYLAYLLSPARRDPRIWALDFEGLSIKLGELERILAFHHAKLRRILELRATRVVDASLEEFESFCDSARDLQELHLSFNCYRHFLHLRHIERIVLAVAKMPKLEAIELSILFSEGKGFTPVTALTVPPGVASPRLRELQNVTINIHSSTADPNVTRYAFPVDTLAQCLAYLGAKTDCKYVLKNRTGVFVGTDVSNRLNKEVHSFQRSTPNGLLPESTNVGKNPVDDSGSNSHSTRVPNPNQSLSNNLFSFANMSFSTAPSNTMPQPPGNEI
ncbi:hypothetical protein C343_04291 [Cryptococcus neoformans C23]|uniref:F-box domain-containing protein n=1 Tax=Cryptococcus neoformans (strain H99 / ATCC 208821 / CBS 10515 / FGSC 9487) TaxID=235443 RepID=J9VWT2_CRYN9|nr:hypothetical protein CNAG_07678 [Cryptococcus neoformans var. grubii H99]XP_012050800.1 hypothetical protein, variant [Cryptococcus neoformans var. grubii H99]AUB26062.1 hypothetical protein CKF44_07678 [Cryptococcus neoformans var. grubii]OWZ30591.1 hypothetical protein C347_04351 [Cryptococcus neoformans var. grubii AD2-60a]OWZ42364.1 hypothetical protein C343_04291 [Cryptococcus neoformans var. grubii C23]OXC83722.1 hypothetical protein C344_04045 [Cryptococcus neoformans var. grubii AD1|eukprot:XP_012050395.1 hypothetical protein CNAG_07678 [Cryptococcus neoformans var. grubii H99]